VATKPHSRKSGARIKKAEKLRESFEARTSEETIEAEIIESKVLKNAKCCERTKWYATGKCCRYFHSLPEDYGIRC
jgi:hypothetical protein